MKLGSAATTTVIQLLTSPNGVNVSLGALAAPDSQLAKPVTSEQVRAQNAAVDLTEHASIPKYPMITVYCEKITNSMREKFRQFSGSVALVIEIRHSHDRLEGLQDA